MFAQAVLSYDARPLRIAVQGFGNVGSVAAHEAYRCNFLLNKVIAVSDRNVTLYNADGLDVPALIDFTASNKGELPLTEAQLSNSGIKADIQGREEVLYLDTDVLILAALEDQIHQDNVDRVKARIIVEGANAPVTGDADRFLNSKGIIVIPDILANAGGVIVSYFEWLQGRETQFYSEEEVFKLLYGKMQSTLVSIMPEFFGNPQSLRQNCYLHSLSKLTMTLYRHGKLY